MSQKHTNQAVMGKIKRHRRYRTADGLVPRQQKLVEAFIATRSVTEAAKQVGYNRDHAKELLRRPDIRALVNRRLREAAKQAQITAVRTLTELAAVGYSSLVDMLGPDGLPAVDRLKDSPQLAAAVSELQVDAQGRVRRVRLHDKMRALHDLAQIQRLLGTEARQHNHQHIHVHSGAPDEARQRLTELLQRYAHPDEPVGGRQALPRDTTVPSAADVPATAPAGQQEGRQP